jgi:hypothetical protein
VYEGFMSVAPPAQRLDFRRFYSASLSGDLADLNVVFPQPGADPSIEVRTAAAAAATDGHCSVLVKAVGSGASQDLLITHTTWSGFNTMTRIFKGYDLPYTLDGNAAHGRVPATYVSFSSYPAAMYSDDDWYTLHPTNLVVTETTIQNNNASLWQYVQPHTVLDWARNMVANRLATDGPTWAAAFSRHNSGTYNNEFMILNYNLFTPGQPLADNLLWVFDQMPGPYMIYNDHTHFLRDQGYWASYNRCVDAA